MQNNNKGRQKHHTTSGGTEACWTDAAIADEKSDQSTKNPINYIMKFKNLEKKVQVSIRQS